MTSRNVHATHSKTNEQASLLDARALEDPIRLRVEERRGVGIVAAAVDESGTRFVVAGDTGSSRRPLDSHTVFEIGSLTKLFTAALLSQMVAAGESDLDEPVSELLPASTSVPSQGSRQITLLDLATHTSALPRLPTNLRSSEPDDPFVGYSIDALYEFLCGYTLVRPIGSVYEYSNLGYGLLGHALACRAGTGYDPLLSQRVLQPLGMTATGMSASVSVDGMAAPHDEANRLVPVMGFGALAPSGALLSTASDMVRFASANLDSAPGPLQRVLAATHLVHRSVGGRRIGLGWHIRRITDWDAVWHSGETRGSRSFIALDLQTSRSVIVLTNSTGRVEDIGFHALDARVELEHERASITLAVSELDHYVGTYDLADGGMVAISRKDDQLIAQATGLGGAPIYPASRTEFFVKAIPVELTFNLDPSGTPTDVTVRFHGTEMHGRIRR